MPDDIRKERPECPRDLADICFKMMQKRPEKRFGSMREVADALESWLKTHGHQFEPGSGESRPAGGGGSGGSDSAKKAAADRVAGGSGKRLATAAPAKTGVDDTVYDKARLETSKGIDSAGDKAGDSSKRLPMARSLPKAKSLDSGSDKKAGSGGFAFNLKDSGKVSAAAKGKTGTTGGIPVTKAGVPPAKPGKSKKPAGDTKSPPPEEAKSPFPVPMWALIAGGGVAAFLLVVVLIVGIMLMMGGSGDSGEPKAPKTKKKAPAVPTRPVPGGRDTSSLQTGDGRWSRQPHIQVAPPEVSTAPTSPKPDRG